MRFALVLAAACVAGWPAFADGHGQSGPSAPPKPAPPPKTPPDELVAGTLITDVVPCSSLCTESDWNGRLDGTSSFTLISLEDNSVPGENISDYSGNLVLSTARGDLIGVDHGTWNLDNGQYVDLYTVTSGTGAFKGATGLILMWGTLDPVTGHGVSRYQGIVTWKFRR